MHIKKQFLRFLAVGGFATAIHYFILIALVQAGFANPVAASSFGFTASALVNYALNRRFTFRSSKRHVQALSQFMLVAVAGLGINAAVLFSCHTLLGFYYLVAQLIATATTVLWNFMVNRLWTFSEVH